MVRNYSLKNDGNKQLSEHFKVKEFACKDGSDKILIDDELVKLLEKIRNFFNEPITITSGFRTESYNQKCGGSTNSQHIKGSAADIRVGNILPIAVSLFCEYVLMKDYGGIGLYTGQNFVHIDVRENKTRWVQPNNSQSYRIVNNIYKSIN